MEKVTQDEMILNIFIDSLNNGYIEDTEEIKNKNKEIEQKMKSFNCKFMFEKDLSMFSDDISDLNCLYQKQGFIDDFKIAMLLCRGEML